MKPTAIFFLFVTMACAQGALGSPTIVTDQSALELKKLKAAVESVFDLNCPSVNESSSPASVDLHNCLPDRVRGVLGSSASLGGPNCYNFSLLSVGGFENLRPVNSNELEDLYFSDTSQFCEDVSSRPASAGDIVSLEQGRDNNQYVRKIHAYVYLTDKYVLTKNGPDTASRWEISTIDEVMNVYPVSSDVKVEKRYRCSVSQESIDKSLIPTVAAIAKFSKFLSGLQVDSSLSSSDYDRLSDEVKTLAAAVHPGGIGALLAQADQNSQVRQAIYELVSQYYVVKSAFYILYRDEDQQDFAESFRVSAINTYLPMLNEVTELSPEKLYGVNEVYSNEDTVDLGFCDDNDYAPNICSLNF